MMVSVSPVLLSSSCVPIRVIICGVLNTFLSKLMFAFPELSPLANTTASGRLSRPAPANNLPLVVFTTSLVKTGPVLVSAKETGGRPGTDAVTVYDPSTLLGPPLTTADDANPITEADARGIDRVGDNRPVHGLDRVVGLQTHHKRVGERRTDRRRLRRAAGEDRHREALALEARPTS